MILYDIIMRQTFFQYQVQTMHRYNERRMNLPANASGIEHNNGSKLCHSASCLLRQVSQAVQNHHYCQTLKR